MTCNKEKFREEFKLGIKRLNELYKTNIANGFIRMGLNDAEELFNELWKEHMED